MTAPPRVLVTRRLPAGALDSLRELGFEVTENDGDVALSKDDLCVAAASFDAIICLLTDRIDRDILRAGRGRLKVVANVAVGYDNIDTSTAAELGIAVCNTPGVLDEATADIAFLLVLAASRLASEAERDLRSGEWQGWGITQYLGHDLVGRTLGVVGWGRIGQAVARRGTGFGMKVIHHCRRSTGVPGYVADLDQLLAQADVVSLHVPLTPETVQLIDERRLALMKPTAVLVNTSRGGVVDELAVVSALEADRLFGVGLDVFENEPAIHPKLLSAPRTVVLPHIGSATVETRTAMARMAADAVADILSGRTPKTLVTPAAR